MDRYLSIEAFVRVAEVESFAAAARQLRVAKSVVSARVQQLEEFVGAPLFHRTTRSVRLSAVGQTFLRDCSELVGRTGELIEQMRDLGSSPSGQLRIHAIPGLVLGHLAAVLRAFQERYPGITLDVVVSDTVVDPERDGFDCALHIFPPQSEQLVERRIFLLRRIFCASPEYLAKHGAPMHPVELNGHRLGLYSRYPTRSRWLFYGASDAAPEAIDLTPTLTTNSVHLLREIALEHAGLVCVPTLVVSDDLLASRLRVVLNEYVLSSFWMSAVYAPTARGSLKLRLFLDALAASFTGEPPWDRALIERDLMSSRVI